MKVTIITVVYNGEKYINDCISSVLNQDYNQIEYIIIDGGSTDATCSIIKHFGNKIDLFISEKDASMYDALNKGIQKASGDIVGILNADDTLASNNVISCIVKEFSNLNLDGVYGNLNYVDSKNPKRIIRKWISKPYSKRDIILGWMPAHPTLYLRRELFTKFGDYSLTYGTAADYQLILRFLYFHQIRAIFINKLMVNMRMGGMSNSSLYQRYLAFVNDFRAIKSVGIKLPLYTLMLKKLRKLNQFLF